MLYFENHSISSEYNFSEYVNAQTDVQNKQKYEDYFTFSTIEGFEHQPKLHVKIFF